MEHFETTRYQSIGNSFDDDHGEYQLDVVNYKTRIRVTII